MLAKKRQEVSQGGETMSENQLKKSIEYLQQRVAHLEFVNDQLFSEIKDVDHLLRLIGFCDGLESIKVAAKEVLEKEREEVD